MLTINELKEYMSIRRVSLRDIEAYCDLSARHISMIFCGDRPYSDENYRQIVRGINGAYAAKKNGTFQRVPLDTNKNPIKETTEPKQKQSKKVKSEQQ